MSNQNSRSEVREIINLQGQNLTRANFSRRNLRNAILIKTTLTEAILTKADLTEADLTEAILRKADLTEAILKDATLKKARLINAHLEGAHLEGAHLEEAVLKEAILFKAHLEGAHLERADLRGAKLEEAFLQGADLRRADLREGVKLMDAYLEGATLTNALLQGADLQRAHLERATLTEANLEGATLIEAHLEGADLKRAHLQRAHLEKVHLEGAHLEGANLTGAFLQGANLTGAFLQGANLTGADLRDINFDQVNLSGIILSHYQRAQISASNNARIRQRAQNNARIRQREENNARIRQRNMNRNSHFFQQRSSRYPNTIIIPRVLITSNDFYFEPNNNSSNLCPDFKHLYEFVMEQELTENFRFEFEGERLFDFAGLTRQVFDKILPVYVDLFFINQRAEDFILLKEDVDLELLASNTLQLIKLAKAAQSQIFLKIHPFAIELLSKEDPKESIASSKNFNSLYANLKARIAEVNSLGMSISNYLLKNNASQQNESLENINKLNREVKAQIILRKRLYNLGFTSWEQYHNMALFIKRFWNTSNDNKVTVTENERQDILDIFVSELKFDIESFKRKIKIIKEDTNEIIDFKAIPKIFYKLYPALKALLQYIFDESLEGDNKRKIFTKYVAGTEYFPGELFIKLTNTIMNSRLHNGQPFYGHSCTLTIDLYLEPSNYNGEEITQNVINTQLKATTSSFQGSE